MSDTMQQPAAGQRVDPFNYPALQRSDLMSLSTINQNKDSMKTNTKKFTTYRMASNNLTTGDIYGKLDVSLLNFDIQELSLSFTDPEPFSRTRNSTT